MGPAVREQECALHGDQAGRHDERGRLGPAMGVTHVLTLRGTLDATGGWSAPGGSSGPVTKLTMRKAQKDRPRGCLVTDSLSLLRTRSGEISPSLTPTLRPARNSV